MAKKKKPSGVPDNPDTPGVDESMVEVEEPLPSVSEEDQADIDEKAEAVSDSAQAVAEAQATLDAAKAEHEAAVSAATPRAVFGKHVYVDIHRSGVFAIHKAPPNWEAEKPRRLSVGGANVELVGVVDAPGQSDDGVWQYRAM